MRPQRSTLVIAAMGAIIAALAWAVVYLARDELQWGSEAHEEEGIVTASAVGADGGFAVVTVSPESQQASGLQTAPLQAVRSQATVEIYGVVVDPRPLVEARARLMALTGEREALRVAAANAQGEYQRLKRLYEDERNVAERAVLAAQAQWLGEQARMATLDQRAASIRDELRSGWGPVLAGWAQTPNAPVLDALVQQQQALVQLVFPYDVQAGGDQIALAPVGAREAQRPARFVSPSPRTDGSLPGATYFYLAGGRDLRVGVRVTGQLRLPGKARDGVLMPDTAVVWHGGKAWAYVKDGDARFVRREVSTAQELPGGWFNADGFVAGDAVVVSGAQLLLSEEFKFQIRNENED